MIKRISVPLYWSALVKDWFLYEYRATTNDTQRERLHRLIHDSRMSALADVMRKTPFRDENFEDYDRDVLFLESVWHVPEQWDFLKNKPSNFLKSELREIELEAKKFVSFLQRHRGTIESQLMLASPAKGYSALTKVKARLSFLEKLLLDISNGSNRPSIVSDADLPHIPRKRGYSKSNEVFAIEQVGKSMREIYGKPHHAVVGICVKVALGLEDDIRPGRVKENLKELRRGGDSVKKSP